jgi:tRNA G18 (ribose-2'-O)-methylase SpoU
MPLIAIRRCDDPQLADYRGVSDAELLRRRNLFVAEGRLIVGRLFDSTHRVVSVLVNDASRRALAPSLSRLPEDVPVYVCETDDFASITGFNLHRGCLALAERPTDRVPTDVMHGCSRLLILEGVTDADNVGSAFRNAAAFGAHVLLSPTCCDPLYRKAIRTSMGSALGTPYARVSDWPAGLASVKANEFTIAALTPRAHARDLASCAGAQKIALLVGSEGPGLTTAAERFADMSLRIPMHGDVDSLNLATATGIALHHFSRQAVIP